MGDDTDLVLNEDSTEAVKELEGRDDVTLYQQRSCDRGGGPPACTDGHFIEPLLERELPDSSSSSTSST